MKDPQSCSKCNRLADDGITRCSECGGWIRGARRIRRLGGVMIVLGLFLVGLMGTITFFAAPIILSGRTSPGRAGFNGTQDEGMLILGLFAIVIVFGLTSILSGAWQIMTGRRSIIIFILILLLTFLMVGVGGVVYKTLDDRKNRGSNGSDDGQAVAECFQPGSNQIKTLQRVSYPIQRRLPWILETQRRN